MTEYNPKSVIVDFNSKSGIITLNSFKDADEFMRKYNEFIVYKPPKFAITYKEPVPTMQQPDPNLMMNPQMFNQQFNNMMMGFGNMNLSKY
jgi:hypothetical protein